MKKILLVAAVLACIANNSIGQDYRKKFQFGLKAGTNFSNIYDSQGDTFDAESKFGLAGGVFMAIPIGKILGIQPEVLFSQKGYKQTGSFLGSTYELNRTTNYIDIPLLVSIKPVSNMTIQVGPQYSYLLKQNDVFANDLTSIQQQNEFKNDNIRKNTLCFIGGVDFNVNRVVIGTRAGWDVLNNSGDGTSTNPRYKNAWLQATIGFRIL